MTVVINGTTGITNDGGYTGDGIVFADTTPANTLVTTTGGNVGIGTSSPSYKLDVAGEIISSTGRVGVIRGDANLSRLVLKNTTREWTISNYGTQYAPNNSFVIADETAAATRLQIDTSGNLLFNSGYGGPAIAYGCRAWVNFNGTGTVAIRASGNVSSITDNGTGNYTVNFTTAMPDANYSATASGQRLMTGDNAAARAMMVQDFSTSSFRIDSISPSNTPADAEVVCATLMR